MAKARELALACRMAGLAVVVALASAGGVRAEGTTAPASSPAKTSPTLMPASSLTPDQRQEIEAMIREYILDHPEVIIDSVRAHQARSQEKATQDTEAAIKDHRAELERDATSPSVGPADADVTIVEFFDYRCGYCKHALSTVQSVLQSDPHVRFVFKEYPILGPDSVVAAKAAQAVWLIDPDKYLAFHVAVMGSRGELTEARLMDLAKSVGVDPKRMRAAMDSPNVAAKLKQNLELGQELNINGTPAFIVGGQFVPGALDIDSLRNLIKDARAG